MREIDNLQGRRKHWDNPRNRAPREQHDLTDSLPYPWEPELSLMFVGMNVLEIGPGRGRQYERLLPVVKSYAICDLSQQALDEPVFDRVTQKFLLSSYADDFVQRFDIIHFWYVLHHVKAGEMEDFFAFVARHLSYRSMAVFNTPQSRNDPGWYTGDGLGTTWMDWNMIAWAILPSMSIEWLEHQDDRSSGMLVVARKR